MIGQFSVLAVVPARGGSKGIAKKNVCNLAGKPLLYWTLRAAAGARCLDRTIVSSEDTAIIEVARQLGADVPFVRPESLARDDTPGIDPVLHALEKLKPFDLVVLLQPTSPLRSAADIDAAVDKLVRTGAMSCVSVTEAKNHPYWTYQLGQQERLAPFLKLPENAATRRQDLPRALVLNGAVYVARTQWLKSQRTFLGTDCVGYEMPPQRSVDIDTEEDLALAERALCDPSR